MDISRMLLRKKTNLLRSAFTDLRQDIVRHPFEDSKTLQIIVQVKAEETEILYYLVEHIEAIEGNFEMTDLEENLNRLKRAYHSTSRQWNALCFKHARQEQSDIAA